MKMRNRLVYLVYLTLPVVVLTIILVLAFPVGRQPRPHHRELSQGDQTAIKPVQSTTVGTIDGSQHPELVPDDRAIHIALLAASASTTGNMLEQQKATGRAAAVVKNLALEVVDAQVLSDVARRYRQAFVASLNGPAVMDSVYDQARMNRITAASAELQTRLSAAGIATFRAFVESAKQHMKLVPMPKMQQHVGSLWERLFGQPVYAQSMSYTVSLYTNMVGDTDSNDTGYFYAYGVTDTSSSCSCHQANVQTTLTSTGGGYVSNSTQGGEFAEVQEAYYLQDGVDYNGDGSITATSIHNSYCPLANFWFVNQQQTVSSNPLQVIRAYYYCDPYGGPCTTTLGHYTHRRCNPRNVCNTLLSRQNSWPFTLQTVAQIQIGSNLICSAEKATAVQQASCSSPDPVPGQ